MSRIPWQPTSVPYETNSDIARDHREFILSLGPDPALRMELGESDGDLSHFLSIPRPADDMHRPAPRVRVTWPRPPQNYGYWHFLEGLENKKIRC